MPCIAKRYKGFRPQNKGSGRLRKWFVLSELFHKNVTLSILGKMPTKTETSKYGVKHTYKTNLISKNGNSVTATVIVVVQKDNDRTTYKIVTVYPY